jgi:Protein of unknown function (DUF2849)
MADTKELVVVTARFLADGSPAYLTTQGQWTRWLQEAAPRTPDVGEAEAEARAKNEQRIVADPYTFKVEVKNGAIDALSTRERIRSTGPTVRVRRPD